MTAPREPGPSSTAIKSLMQKILLWAVVVSIGIAIAAAVLGYIFAGSAGFYSGLIGAAVACGFFSVTVVIMLITAESSPTTMAAGVMGGFLIKIAGMLGVIALLNGQDFYHPLVLFLTLVAGACASLVIDVVAVTRSRIPNVDPGLKP